MSDLLAVLLVGLSTGCLYGVVALTFTSIYNVARVINFAQGDFVMLGAAFTFVFATVLHLPLVVALPLVLVSVSVVGLGVQQLMVGPLVARNAPISTTILGTLAMGLIISGAVGVLTGYSYLRTDPLLGYEAWRVGEVAVNQQYLLVIAATLILVVAYWFLLRRTHVGVALRATGANREMARMVGISNVRMMALAFVVSAAMSGLVGFLSGPITTASAAMGLPLVIKGFIAAIFGGLGNPYGAVVGGLFLGLVSSILTGYFTSAHAEVVTFVILLAVLLLRPHGLFGEKE